MCIHICSKKAQEQTKQQAEPHWVYNKTINCEQMAYAKTSAVCIAQAVWQKILITYLVYWDASRIIKLIEWNVDAKSEWTEHHALFYACAHNYVSR